VNSQEGNLKRIKVGVLMGGRSIEKEVSLNSGRTICDHLDVHKYDIIPIFQDEDKKLYILPWHFLHRGKISDFQYRLKDEATEINWNKLKEFVDFIYLAVHGRNCEDGSIQAMLEFLDIPHTGSSFYTSSVVSCKNLNNKILKNNGFNVPREVLIKYTDDSFFKAIEFTNQINYPLVVKPIGEGSSFGVSIVKNEEELINGIVAARSINKDILQDVVVQEKIIGMEFSCIVIQDKNKNWISLEPTEIAHKSNDYLFEYVDKYMPGEGEKYTPARCSIDNINKIKKVCINVAKVLEANDILRIDGFIDNNEEIIILESNIFPGTAPTSFTFLQAAHSGMSHRDLINFIIESALSRYKNKFSLEDNYNLNLKKETQVRIGVIFGGESNERETSLESGRNVIYKLSTNIYNVTPLFMTKDLKFYKLSMQQLVKNSTNEILLSLLPEQEVILSDFPNFFDFVFLALHGGVGENGCLQGVLETLSIPYNGSGISTNYICMDKYKTHKILLAAGFDVPNHEFISNYFTKDEISEKYNLLKERTINEKFIVKPHDDGCSVMVQFCENLEDVLSACELIFSKSKSGCLIEEYIDAMELTVGVIGNENPIVLPPSGTTKKKPVLSAKEKFLPGEGENITPAPISEDDMIFVKDIIKKAYLELNCKGYARIDCFLKKTDKERKLIILEFNTLPALTPATCLFHQAAEIGIKPMELIDEIIRLGKSLLSCK